MAAAKESNMCEPCNKRQKQLAATYWCRTCKNYICDDCKDVHRGFEELSDHVIIYIPDIIEDEEKILSDTPHLLCYKHKTEPATLYCRDDKQAFCAACSKSSHAYCHEILHLDDIAKNLCEDINKKDLQKLLEIKNIIESILVDEDSSESNFESKMAKIENTIDEKIEKTIHHIRKLGKVIKDSICDIKSNEKKNYKERREHMRTFIVVLQTKIKTAELCSKMKDSQAISAKFEMKNRLCTDYKPLKRAIEATTENHITFEQNEFLCQLENLTALGKIKEQKTPSHSVNRVNSIFSCIDALNQGLLDAPLAQVFTCPTKPKLKKVISRQHINIDNPYLYDSDYLPDGRLVVSDCKRNKLLLFSTNITLQAQYDVLSMPHGICVSADDALIYLMHSNGKLVTYRLQKTLTEISRFKMQNNTKGVGVSGDTIITGNDKHIILYNKMEAILPAIDKSGIPTLISVSQDGKKFYHRDGNDIICRNVSDQKVVFKYSHPELKGPWGIACDRHGNVLIVGHESHNVIMISDDGKQGKVLLDKLHNIKHPTALSCHPKHDEFIVTSYKGEDTAIEVYEMK